VKYDRALGELLGEAVERPAQPRRGGVWRCGRASLPARARSGAACRQGAGEPRKSGGGEAGNSAARSGQSREASPGTKDQEGARARCADVRARKRGLLAFI